MTAEELVKKARAAREFAYAPYSKFQVGAAVLCEDGSVFTGCNVENASYGGTVCAERTAAVKAVSFGYTRFEAVAIVGGPAAGELAACPPCGICRQFLSEFCGEDTPIYMGVSDTDYEEQTLGRLLPLAFHLD